MDAEFIEIVKMTLGDGADGLIHKLSETERKKQQKQALVALGGNVVGLAAGGAALYTASKNPAIKGKLTDPKDAGPVTGRVTQPKNLKKIPSARVRRALSTPRGRGKLYQAGAAGAVGLQAANTAGDVVGNIVLRRDAKAKGRPAPDSAKVAAIKETKKQTVDRVAKMEPGSADVHLPGKGKLIKKPKQKAVLSGAPDLGSDEKVKVIRKTLRFNKEVMRDKYNEAVENGTAKPNGKMHGKYLQPVPQKSTWKPKKEVKKNMDVTWEGEISKVDEDKRQVFGWASIVEVNGEPVVDLQGDYIDIDEVEKSAYDYVIKSRKGGDMHARDGENAKVVGQMIESFIVTPEKKEKMGLPDSMPTGWWVGYQVEDPEVWNLVKSGKRTGFSIHGRGVRTPMEV